MYQDCNSLEAEFENRLIKALERYAHVSRAMRRTGDAQISAHILENDQQVPAKNKLGGAMPTTVVFH